MTLTSSTVNLNGSTENGGRYYCQWKTECADARHRATSSSSVSNPARFVSAVAPLTPHCQDSASRFLTVPAEGKVFG